MATLLRTSAFAISLAVAYSVFSTTAVSAPPEAAGGDASEVETGQILFNRFGCYQCHGHFGQGGAAGPKIALNAYPFEAFATLVRRPLLNMPPYTEKVLTEEQLRSIHEYVTSIEKGTSADDIPLLR